MSEYLLRAGDADHSGYESPLGAMYRVTALQERGATLPEIAASMKLPLAEVHRIVTEWLWGRK